MSRYSVLTGVALCAVVSLSVFAADPIRVLIVTGGHDFEREAFFEMFDSMENVTYREVIHPNTFQMFQSNKRSSYDVIVLYDMNQDIPEQDAEAAMDMLQQGKGIVALHHCIASYNDRPEYEEIIGGKYFLKETREGGEVIPQSTYDHDQTVKVEVCDSDHPITKGIEDFTIYDETYKGFRVSDDVHPLLKTDHPKSSETIAWCHKYWNSRVAYIQLGHDHHAYENPNYRKLVHQAIEWAAGKR